MARGTYFGEVKGDSTVSNPKMQGATSSEVADNGALRYNTNVANKDQDPSALTTQQLLRENFWLRELLEARLSGIESRIEQGDKAVSLLQAFADRTPTTMDVQHEVIALRELAMEKFASVATQFVQRDTAVQAALQAQEKQAIATNDSNNKAIAKMEDNFTKLIEQGRELLQSVKDNTDVQIGDIKSRLDKGDGIARGSDKTTDRTSSVIGQVIAGAVAFVVIMTAIVGLVAFMATRTPQAPQVIYTPAVPQTNNR